MLQPADNKSNLPTLESIYRSAPIGIGLTRDRILLWTNTRLQEMLGYTAEELLNQSARILYPSTEEFNRVGRVKYAAIAKYKTGSIETQWRHKDGSLRDIFLSSSPLDVDDFTKGMTFTALDITKRLQAEKSLRESEQKFREVVDLLPEIIYEMDTAGNLTWANKNAFTNFGYSEDELSGGLNALAMVIDEDRDRALTNTTRLLQGQIVGLTEYTVMRKDGSTFPAMFHSAPINRDGQIVGLRGIIIDLSEKKAMERQLRHSQKMEAIGTLSAGIAHDFNNMLGAILGFSELAIIDNPANQRLQHQLKEIHKASTRASRLIRQILAFSRQTEQELRPAGLALIIKEVIRLLRATIPSHIHIEEIIDPTAQTSLVLADQTQMHQVLMNLCTNAYHAMREKGGLISISLDYCKVSDGFGVQHDHHLENRDYLLLRVGDTGTGIAPEILDRVFEPYFTTKPREEGTGMGLSVVHGIIAAHGGHIYADSIPGEGSIFSCYLPVINSENPKIEPEMEELPVGGTESILFVDDEEPLVLMNTELLETLGYRVISFSSSVKALEAFRENPGRFDLIITDMNIPHMTGAELAKNCLKIRPDIPVILCTGYSEIINEEKAEAMGIKAFLMKPIVFNQLSRVIRTALGDSSAP